MPEEKMTVSKEQATIDNHGDLIIKDPKVIEKLRQHGAKSGQALKPEIKVGIYIEW